MNYRVIARLDIKGPNLVKGIHLEGLRVLGKPEDYAKYYYENGIDELIYQDVVASLFERNSLKEIISKTASATFIPLTVGGGLRTVDDIRFALRAGADKVSINTAAIRNPNLIQDAAKEFDGWVMQNYPTAQQTASGLYYVVEQEGTGEQATPGKTVAVHYSGKLTNGNEFDNSYRRGQPIEFKLGSGQVIPGWDEGIALMKVGSKYKLIIPSKLGYGKRGAGGVIPPNATLVFDTELVSVK